MVAFGRVATLQPRSPLSTKAFAISRPDASLMHLAEREGVIILKSFGKFWGLAGLRLDLPLAILT